MPVIDAAFIAAISGLVIALATALVKLRDAWSKAEKVKSDALITQSNSWKELSDVQQAQIEKLDNRLSDMRCELDKIVTSRAEAQHERDEMKAQVEVMKRDLDRLAHDRDRTEKQRDSLQVQLYDLQNKTIPALEKRIDQLKQIVIKLGGELPPTGPLAGT